jgi:hypothetical protein
MNFSLIPFAATWIALACPVLILAIYRRRIAGQEDDTLQVTDSQHRTSPSRLRRIRWPWLTVEASC